MILRANSLIKCFTWNQLVTYPRYPHREVPPREKVRLTVRATPMNGSKNQLRLIKRSFLALWDTNTLLYIYIDVTFKTQKKLSSNRPTVLELSLIQILRAKRSIKCTVVQFLSYTVKFTIKRRVFLSGF